MIIFFVNYPVGVDDIRHYEIFVHFGNLLAKILFHYLRTNAVCTPR